MNADAAWAKLHELAELLEAKGNLVVFISANPGLLSLDTIRGLLPRVSNDERLYNALGALDQLRRMLGDDIERYPLGQGPIEGIVQQLELGAIGFAEATKRARAASVTEQMSSPYATALIQHAFTRIQGDLTAPGVLWSTWTAQLAIAATDDVTSGDGLFGRLNVNQDWLQVARMALGFAPNGQWFASALASAAYLRSRVGAGKPEPDLGRIEFLVGILHLDPWVSGRSANTFKAGLGVWQLALDDLYGARAPKIRKEFPMPEPEEALATAVDHLRKAVALRVGAGRGLAIKALAQALHYRQAALGVAYDLSEWRALFEAADAIEDDSPLWRNAYAHLQELREASELGAAPGRRVPALPAPTTPSGVFAMASAIAAAQPVEAFKIVLGARNLFGREAGEARREMRFKWLLSNLARAEGVERPELQSAADLQPAARALRARASREGWPPHKLHVGLMDIALSSSLVDAEDVGLELFAEVVGEDPEFFGEERDIGRFARGSLFQGRAVVLAKAKRWNEALAAYAEASLRFALLEMSGLASRCLEALADCARNGDPSTPENVVIALAPVAHLLDAALGAVARQALADTYRHATSHLGDDLSEIVLDTLLQLGKGFVTAGIVQGQRVYKPSEDPEVSALLQKRASLTASVESPESDTSLDEVRLLAQPGVGVVSQGSEPEDLRRNVEIALDRRIATGLRMPNVERAALLTSEGVRACLDDRTVLLNYFVGEMAGEHGCIFLSLTTREARAIVRNPLGAKLAPLAHEEGERTTILHPLAPLVRAVRLGAQRDAGPRALHRDAREVLEQTFESFLGTAASKVLADLRAQGKDHLCIVPHGAFHYFPYHLLPYRGGLLCDEWIVTHLPSLCLLPVFPRWSGEPPPARSGARAFGMSFAGGQPHGLPELADSRDETRAVAAAFGTPGLLDADVTERSLRHALRTCRRVHLSTHGAMNFDAPSLHCVFLTPEGNDDGRLHAFEVAEEDLRGLEVLSLSACETALGRVDETDNLQGLPAAFLNAGVETLVTTLWPASSAATGTFFPAFHEQLARGAERRDAFAIAQRATRKKLPQARDWAPFQLAGAWGPTG